MPLVVGKPALVRVYLRSGMRSFGPATAALEVKRRSPHGAYTTIARPHPDPPGQIMPKSDPPYEQERGDMNSLSLPRIPGSINFAIPAEIMSGSLVFHVTVRTGRLLDGDLLEPLLVDTRDVSVDVSLRQTLRLRSIMVGYSGPKSSTDPAPLFVSPPVYPNDLITTARATLIAFPVRNTADTSSAGWITCDQPLDDGAGCSPNWNALIAKLVAQRTADGNRSDAIYYGLLPTQIPFRNTSDLACEHIGMSAGRVDGLIRPSFQTDGGRVMAHQLGHDCGLLHAPGTDNFDALDPNYPAYPPYDPIGLPKGSIGEYGVTIGGETWINLARYKDIMGSIGWRAGPLLSLYHYGRLLENPMLDPVFVGGLDVRGAGAFPKRSDGMDLQPAISIIGLQLSETAFRITSVMRVETRPSSTAATGLTATLREQDGSLLAQAPLLIQGTTRAGGCGCRGNDQHSFPRVVQALIPDVGRGAVLSVGTDASQLWTSRPSPTRPSIARFDVGVDRAGNELTVGWQVQAAGDPEVWLQWSEDDGRTWNALATCLAGEHATFDTAILPSGSIGVRLLASDGFDTVRSRLVRVDLPRRAPAIAILTPGDGETLIAGGTMRLWGAVTMNGRSAITLEHARWSIDGRPVSEGLDTFCPAPAAGDHLLELTAIVDGLEGRATQRLLTHDADPNPGQADRP